MCYSGTGFSAIFTNKGNAAFEMTALLSSVAKRYKFRDVARGVISGTSSRVRGEGAFPPKNSWYICSCYCFLQVEAEAV